MPTPRQIQRTSESDSLYLHDDPYLLECARWRAVLGDKPAPAKRNRKAAQWPHWALAVTLGIALALLAVHSLAK